MDTFYGVLAQFFETGCEGAHWVLERFDKTGYDQIVFLKKGDQLTIYDEDGHEVYSGVIEEDRMTNLQQRPLTTIVQPVCSGLWVHWLQSGVDPPEVWGDWILSGRFTGVLAKQPVAASSENKMPPIAKARAPFRWEALLFSVNGWNSSMA